MWSHSRLIDAFNGLVSECSGKRATVLPTIWFVTLLRIDAKIVINKDFTYVRRCMRVLFIRVVENQ